MHQRGRLGAARGDIGAGSGGAVGGRRRRVRRVRGESGRSLGDGGRREEADHEEVEEDIDDDSDVEDPWADEDEDGSGGITPALLERLKVRFNSYGEDGLARDEFVKEFANVIGARGETSEQELTQLFMKIDANSDGTVSWDEFSTHLLNEAQTFAVMHNPSWQFERKRSQDTTLHHHDMITSITPVHARDEYVTTCRDGTALVWDAATLKAKHLIDVAGCGRTIASYFDRMASRRAHSLPSSSSARAHSSSSSSPASSQPVSSAPTSSPPLSPSSVSLDAEPDFHTRQMVSRRRKKAGWLLASAFMARSQRLAVATMDRRVHFFDANAGVDEFGQPISEWRHVGVLKKARNFPYKLFDHVPSAMTSQAFGVDREVLAIGNDVGNILLMAVLPNWSISQRPRGRVATRELRFQEICASPDGRRSSKRVPSARSARSGGGGESEPSEAGKGVTYFTDAHTSTITHMAYRTELRSLITASLDGTVKQWAIDECGTIPPRLKSTYRGHRSGVYCFDFSPKNKIIASCGLEHDIHLWDPHRCAALDQRLSGHLASVQWLQIDDSANVLVSLSIDHVVKVWDLRNMQCTQTMQDTTLHRPQNRVSAMHLDLGHERFLTLGGGAHVWAAQLPVSDAVTSHDHSIVAALYNTNFFQVVSVDGGDPTAALRARRRSTVSVWSVDTGKRVSFFKPSGSVRSAAFDVSQRRLMTGDHHGNLGIWNFNSGECLFEHVDPVLRDAGPIQPKEVAAVQCAVQRRVGGRLESIADADAISEEELERAHVKVIFSTGWDRKFKVWRDGAELEKPGLKPGPIVSMPPDHDPQPTCDLLSLTACRLSVATGDFDGNVLLWNSESGRLWGKLSPSPESLAGTPPTERAADVLVYLPRKDVLLSSGSDGYLRFWRTSRPARRLYEWKLPGLQHGEAITCVSRNRSEDLVVVGDSSGCVTLVDMHRVAADMDRAPPLVSEDGTPIDALVPVLTWHAHSEQITSIAYVERGEHQLVLTASADKTLVLWSRQGRKIGMFGQGRPWNLDVPSTWHGRKALGRTMSEVLEARRQREARQRARDKEAKRIADKVAAAAGNEPEAAQAQAAPEVPTLGSAAKLEQLASLDAGELIESGRWRELVVPRSALRSRRGGGGGEPKPKRFTPKPRKIGWVPFENRNSGGVPGESQWADGVYTPESYSHRTRRQLAQRDKARRLRLLSRPF